MGTNGPTFYDNDTVFATYQRGRQRPDNPKDILEKPVILALRQTYLRRKRIPLFLFLAGRKLTATPMAGIQQAA